MSTSVLQQMQQQQQQDDLRGLMPPLMNHANYEQHHSAISNDDYTMAPAATHHYNDQDQYPSYEEFDAIVQDYLQNLSSKKRDKALIDQARYGMILQVLKDPRNTAVSTAQFRFWVKKMFQLTSRHVVCHDGKPVAMREHIYGILVRAHREAHHGGRDKTSALVRRKYSWIPKELIARFVRHCPFCISRRNGSQQSPLSLGIFLPATPPSYSMMSSVSMSAEESRQRAPSMIASASSASSNSSYPDEMVLMAAAVAHHQQQSSGQQQQQQQQQQPISHFASGTTLDMSWQTSSASPHQSYYATDAMTATSVSAPNSGSFFDNQQHHGSYYNTRHPYMMTYSSSHNSSIDVEKHEQHPMTMQPALSVYYPQEYDLKQESYSLIESSNPMTFVTPHRNDSAMVYTSGTSNTHTATVVAPVVNSHCVVASSPSLSPSSSSTSSTSSPVHPAYHETNHNESKFAPQASTITTAATTATNTLSLLSHHQSLF